MPGFNIDRVVLPAPGGALGRDVHLAGPSGCFDDLPRGNIYSLPHKWNRIRFLVYFVRHHIGPGDVEVLPERARQDEEMQKHAAVQFDVRTGGDWQGKILKFVAGQVKKIVEEHHAQNKDLGNLSEDERHDIWAAYFRRNPLGVAKEMWNPISAIDYDAIFFPPQSANDETKAKLQLCHDYIVQCWILAAENSFLFRILAKDSPEAIAELKLKKQTEYTLWQGMSVHPKVVVPSIEDIPVTVQSLLGMARRTR